MESGFGKDILIIGGGVIGLAIARELHKAGAGSVGILERGVPGREASFAAAGMLAPHAECDIPDAFFRICSASNQMYPEFASELLEETGVDVEFDDAGTLFLAFSERDLQNLNRRFEWQSEAGMGVERLGAKETHSVEPFSSPDSVGSLFFPDDRQVENRSLLLALLNYAALNGIEIHEHAEVASVETRSGAVTGVKMRDGRLFEAGTVVLAAGAWTSSILSSEEEPCLPAVRPVRGQMIGFRTAKRLFTHVIYSHRGYIVPRKLGRILVGATTEDVGFEDEVTEDGISQLKEAAIEISPSLANIRIEEKWSGLRPYTEGGRPIIGAIPSAEGLFAATAHYRNGILLAPLTGKLLARQIVTGEVPEQLAAFKPRMKADLSLV